MTSQEQRLIQWCEEHNIKALSYKNRTRNQKYPTKVKKKRK